MAVNPENEFDCCSCKYSVGGHNGKLFCWLNSREADSVCSVYTYEAGTDATVRQQSQQSQQPVDEIDTLL